DFCSQKFAVHSTGVYTFPNSVRNPALGNVDCSLVLETDVGKNIQLKIENLNIIEGVEQLVLLDGGLSLDASRAVVRLTEPLTSPRYFYSSNNMMILNFLSTREGVTGTFQVTYEPVTHGENILPSNMLIATDQVKELAHPLYDTYELGSQDFTYIIEAEDPRKTITVEILDQDLAPDAQVIFRDGDSIHSGILSTLRGSYKGNHFVLSSGRKFYLTKQTRLGGLNKGIKFRYTQGCNVEMNQTAGYISSPGFPSNYYPNGVECRWRIAQPDGLPVTLKVDSLDLHPEDTLQIYDANATLMRTYTGSVLQDPLRVTSGIFSAVFTASPSFNRAGFNLSFSYDCPQPDLDLARSTITPGVSTSYGSSFTVRCNRGSAFLQEEHKNKTEARMVCGAWGRWNVNTSPKCMPALCPKAPGLRNGYVASSTGSLAYQGSLTYKCYQGFTITGPDTVTCQADGSWTQMPTCETSRCSPLPGSPGNGSHTVEGDGTSYGTIVRFSCDPGYDLIGNTTMLCDSQGQWVGNMPTCRALTCYTSDIAHGEVSANTVEYLKVITLTCDPGYRTSINPITSMVCTANRTLTPQLTCQNIDECVETSPCNMFCTDLPGSYSCQCDVGYQLRGDECLGITCAVEPVPATGLENPGVLSPTNVTSIEFGGSLNISCHVPGRIPVSNFTRTRRCALINGHYGLDGSVQDYDCPVIKCGQPDDLPGTEYRNLTGLQYGDTATFGCDAQYTISGASGLGNNTTITCQANGKWDLGSLLCSGKTCPDPGQIHFGVQRISDYRSQVVFACTVPGFEIRPLGSLVCELNSNGTASYNASLPACVDVNPPVLQSPCANGSIQLEVAKFTSIGDVMPTITAVDRETGIASLEVNPAWPSRKEYITSAAEVKDFTYTFSDFAGNKAECKVRLVGKDTTKPKITCPGSVVRTFASLSDEILVSFSKSNVTVSDDYSTGENITVRFEPPSYLFKAANVQMLTAFPRMLRQTIQATAMDKSGNSAVCKFDLLFTPDVCSRYNVRQHNNVSLACQDTNGGVTCTATCDAGYRLYEDPSKSSTTFSCPGPGQPFNRTTDVTCVNIASNEFEGAYHLLFDATYISDSANKSCKANYEDVINSTLNSIPKNYTQEWCSRLSNPSSAEWKLVNLYVDEATKQVRVKYEILFERQPRFDYTPCSKLLKLILEVDKKSDFLRKHLSNFKPSQCAPLTLQDGSTNMDTLTHGYFCPGDNRSPSMIQINSDLTVGICLKCPEGTYKAPDSTCVKCPRGTYSSKKDVSACTICQSGTSTHHEGAKDSGECTDQCGTGSYNAMTGLPPCAACPKDTFRMNATTCLPCPGNQTTKTSGANFSDDCVEQCAQGYFNEDDGYLPCRKCPPHTYSNSKGARRCTPCNVGTYTKTEGSTSVAECLNLVESTECSSRCVNGRCTNNHHSHSCTCLSGTSGTHCEVTLPTCTDQTCLNNGMCENLVGGPKCHCLPGFSGPRCNISEDLCKQQPCGINGQCIAHDNVRYSCVCKPGYTGTNCQELQDQCYSNPCHNNATCQTTGIQGFSCDCSSTLGYDGTFCERRQLKCNTGTRCGAGAKCVEDEDNDSYICVCPPQGQYKTPAGPRTQTCDPINFCQSDPCLNGGTCRNEASGFSCSCPDGYNGFRCQHDIDHCASSPCLHDGVCTDLLLGYNCTCSGYTGANCETEINECLTSNCSSTGTAQCIDKVRDFECKCSRGYAGKYCHIDIKECASSPCLHGGRCNDLIADYRCDCPSGWTGSNCEVEVKHCTSDPCQNGAECKELFDDFFCSCQLNTFGATCSESVKICDVANPCVNGTCRDDAGNATCACHDNFAGDRCEEKINPCSTVSGVCQNEAVCIASLDNHQCRCAPGFTGPLCAVNPSDCHSINCSAQATCVDLPDKAICRCPLGKEGPGCDYDTDSNFDLLFRHSDKTSMAALEYPISLSNSSFSVSMWIQFAEKSGTGVFFSIFTVPSPNSLRGKTPLLYMNETAVRYQDPTSGQEFTITQPIAAINDGRWHYLVVNIDGAAGQMTYIADTVQSSAIRFPRTMFDLK
ncbi:neurogenic locus notch homolog protein 1, partial [Elysia marginata]